MADKTATFAVELDDGASGPAKNAESALQALQEKIQADTRALNDMQRSMRAMQKGTSVNVAAFQSLRDAIAAKRETVAKATSSYVQLGGTFDRVAASTEKMTAASKKAEAAHDKLGTSVQQVGDGSQRTGGQARGLAEVLQGLGGRTGQTAGKAKQLTQALGKGGVAGAILLVVAVAALMAVALGIAIVKLTMAAVKAAEAARSFSLLATAATGSAGGARMLEQSIERVTRSVAITREEAGELALELARAGLSGTALENALRASAMAAKTMGDAAGQKLKQLAIDAKKAGKVMWQALDFEGAGVSLDAVATELAKQLNIGFAQAKQAIESGTVTVDQGLAALDRAVQKKFGKIAKAQLLSFDHQLKRAKENVSKLFSGINIEPFLKALASVLELLDESTATGRALKAILTTIIQPIIDALARAAPLAKGFFKGMVIAALIFAIAVLKVKNAIKDAFGSDTEDSILTVENAVKAGIAVMAVFAAVVGIVAAAFFLLALPLIIVAALIYLVVTAVGAIIDAFGEAVDYIAGLDLMAVGTEFIQGLINGVKSGAGALYEAVTNLAKTAVAKMKAALGIASPSKVMMQVGGFTAEGFTAGIEDGEEDAAEAMTSLATPPDEPQMAAMGSRSGGDRTVNITLHVAPGADKRLLEPTFLERLAEAVEAAVQAGGGELEVPS